jgi:hypothetical protein
MHQPAAPIGCCLESLRCLPAAAVRHNTREFGVCPHMRLAFYLLKDRNKPCRLQAG